MTLSKITDFMGKHYNRGVTAEELGIKIGASRTTARRYLEYLVSSNKAKADLSYGTVGRPERRYFSV
ncbi:hypothetical protein [Pseudalkalibacillus caeni]|uniref:hypothetical protein n=1 Tax=Exobacillus caeni TaxID=2574798 RepID=UPI00269946FB